MPSVITPWVVETGAYEGPKEIAFTRPRLPIADMRDSKVMEYAL
jgi:hypothetical protein